jgi:hypothetical protein
MWHDASVFSRKRNPKRQCNQETQESLALFVLVNLMAGIEVVLSAIRKCVFIVTFTQYCITTAHLWEYYYFIINKENHSHIVILVNANAAAYALLLLRYIGVKKIE